MVIGFEKAKAILEEKKDSKKDAWKLDEKYYRDQVRFFEKWYEEHDMYDNKVNRNR